MPANETVLYRGARFELGRGPGFYGIWPAGAARPPSIEWWPETPEGWRGAWSRFTGLETPASISAAAPASTITAAAPPGTIIPGGPPATASPRPANPAVTRARAVAGAALLAAGTGIGIASLFPGYFGSASLAQQPPQLVTHAIYLAVWAASTLLILRSGNLARVGALLGLGTSIVTFGFFFADTGTAIAGGGTVGAGLVLGLVGWLLCTAGSVAAFRFRPAEALGKPNGPARDRILRLALATVAALGAAIAFAPSWDSYALRAPGQPVQSLTAGNAFANPGLVIFGNVAVMVLLVVVVAAAAWWRPVRLGALLLAGATIPMVASAIEALVQVREAVSPTQFGISRAQASQVGLTISSGLTPVFWVYCAFVLALAAICGWMLLAPRRANRAASPVTPWTPASWNPAPWAPAPAVTLASPAAPPASAETAGPAHPGDATPPSGPSDSAAPADSAGSADSGRPADSAGSAGPADSAGSEDSAGPASPSLG